MVRTQISLTQDELDALDAESRRTGSSRSELIRRAVRARYGARSSTSVDEKIAALEAVAGIWADRPFTTEEYLDAIRHGRALPDE